MPKWNPVHISSHSLTSAPALALGNNSSVFYDLHFLNISHKRKHTLCVCVCMCVCVVLHDWLPSLSVMFLRVLHVLAAINPSLLLLPNNIALHRCRNIRVIYTSYQLWRMLLRTIMYPFLHGTSYRSQQDTSFSNASYLLTSSRLTK